MLIIEIDRKHLNYDENLKCMPYGNYAIWEVTFWAIKYFKLYSFALLAQF